MARYSEPAQRFIARRMREFHSGEMEGRGDRKITDKKQALAIALSEARKKGMEVSRNA